MVNLTTAMPTSYPAVVVNNVSRGGTYATSITSSSFLVESWSSGGNYVDPTEVNFIVVG
jgi:cobyric acid synthase